MAIEASLSKTLWNAIEKHQTFVLSMRGGTDGSQLRLARANAALSRIDLVVGALAPFCIAALASSLGVSKSLGVLVATQLTVAVAVAPSLMQTFAGLHSVAELEDGTVEAGDIGNVASCESLRGVLTIIFAQALLYFTVIAPSGILLIWLRARQLSETKLSVFVSVSQLFGAAGSWIPALMMRMKMEGLEQSAAKMQAAHAATVVAAAIAVSRHNVYALLLATTLSRASLWAIDLLGRQVASL